MLFRGHVADSPRLPGGLEQAYPETLRQAVTLCGLATSRWVTLAKDKNLWKQFLEKSAVIEYMKGWHVREEEKKSLEINVELLE
jgi:hypothetical protein